MEIRPTYDAHKMQIKMQLEIFTQRLGEIIIARDKKCLLLKNY